MNMRDIYEHTCVIGIIYMDFELCTCQYSDEVKQRPLALNPFIELHGETTRGRGEERRGRSEKGGR